MTTDPIPPTIEWRRGRVRLVDQRRLPGRLCFVECASVGELRDAIVTLAVRGAPALGAAGAFGVALAASTLSTPRAVASAAARAARGSTHGREPRMGRRPRARGVPRAGPESAEGAAAALAEAHAIAAADVAANRALGAHGAALLPDGARVLTHCNAGALACVGYGTALGVVRAAAEAGKHPHVWVGETRPVLQGARLTAWELGRLGIAHTLVTDTVVASLMADGEVDAVVVGADRIAANGDVANKIGTYQLAVAGAAPQGAVLVAAPWSTVDPATPRGAAIVIEARPASEVTTIAGTRVAPAGVAVRNPAFDVTPAGLVTAIVTDHGVARRPYPRSLSSRSLSGLGRKSTPQVEKRPNAGGG